MLDSIVSAIPVPDVTQEGPVQMLITQTESNQYFGKMLIGRVAQGKISVGEQVQTVDQDGKVVEQSKVMKISKRFGMHDIELKTAYAGDIVSIAGF